MAQGNTSWTQLRNPVNLVVEAAISDIFYPPHPGIYWLKAVYSGYNNYHGSEIDVWEEVMIVEKAPSTIVTDLSMTSAQGVDALIMRS